MSAADMFLSRAEVDRLTGAKTRKKQVEVLRRNGIRHTLDAGGWPVVTRTAVEGRPAEAQDRRWKPNKAA